MSKEPNRVVLEITPTSYSYTVFTGKKVIARQEMQKCPGGAKGTEKAAVFEEALEDYQGLLDAIENESAYDIMYALAGER